MMINNLFICANFAMPTHKPSAYFVTCFALSKFSPAHPIANIFASAVPPKILALLQLNVEMERFELLTPCLQGRCSPN